MNKSDILNHFAGNFLPFYDRFLETSKAGEKEYKAKCPFHDDKNPSLNFNPATGTFLCHGCKTGGDILTFYGMLTGLDPKTDFPEILKGISEVFGINGEGKAPEKLKIVKTYEYTDEKGDLLFQVCRLDPKSFRQRRPDGKGSWTWSLAGTRRVLYRLPEVIKAREVILVEGEKDADRLHALGFTATTNPGGAGKWKPEYSEVLRGKDLILIPDNDDPGRKHVEAVSKALAGIAASIRTLTLPDLPEKGDVSDFLDRFEDPVEAGERLAILIDGLSHEEKPPVRGFHIIHISQLKFKKPDWLVKDLIEMDSLVQFFGDPESGKSLTALDLAACVATGKDFHGKPVRQGAVLSIIGEGRGGITRRKKAWEIANQISLDDFPFYVSSGPTSLCDPEEVDQVLEAIGSLPKEYPLVLVILDTLARNFGPGDENSTKDMTASIASMDRIRIPHRCTVLPIHHSGHGDKSRARGAMALRGALDSEYRFDRDENDIIRMEATKMKDAERPEPMAFKIATVDLGILDENGKPITSAVLVPTEYEPPMKKTKAQGKRQTTAMDQFDKLHAEHVSNLEKNGYPAKGARVSVDDWAKACRNAGIQTNRFHEAKKALQEKQVVKIEYGYVSRI